MGRRERDDCITSVVSFCKKALSHHMYNISTGCNVTESIIAENRDPKDYLKIVFTFTQKLTTLNRKQEIKESSIALSI